MNLLPLPAFTDNYIWMLHDSREAIVVDQATPRRYCRALHDNRDCRCGNFSHAPSRRPCRRCVARMPPGAVFGPHAKPYPSLRLRQADADHHFWACVSY